MEITIGSFEYDAASLVFIPIGLVAMLVFRLVMDVLTPFDDNAQMINNNRATALARAGQYIGFTIALAGSMLSPGSSFGDDIVAFSIDACVVIVMMAIAAKAFDQVILRNIDNAEALAESNHAVGAVEAASYIGLGLVMFSAFNGEGQSIVDNISISAVFGLLGVAVLMINYALMGAQVDTKVGNGDMSSAVRAAGVILSVSIALIPAIAGDSNGWGSDLTGFGIFAVLGTAVVWVVSRIATVVVTPNKLATANLSSTVAVSAATVATVVLYAAAA